MHEIAIQFDSDNGNENEDNKKSGNVTSQFQIQALKSCLTSMHKSLDMAMSLDMHYMLCMPTSVVARTSYAAVSLMKLFSFVSSHKDSIGQVLDPKSLKVEQYLDRTAEYHRRVGELKGGRTASRFFVVLTMLRSWFVKRKEQNVDKNEATVDWKQANQKERNGEEKKVCRVTKKKKKKKIKDKSNIPAEAGSTFTTLWII